MATTVKITETYDMKTTVNKMGLVGIHTPQVTQLRKLYPGLLKNHRFFRFIKCDVVGACASVLPADPLQVGVSSGQVAPEDMFNPILYKAVTNTSFDTLVARIRDLSDVSALGSVEAGNALDNATSVANNFNVYYALLAEKGKWRKAMPQSGFQIKNLVPLAHTLVSTFGNVGSNMGNEYAVDSAEYDVPVPDMGIPNVDEGWTVKSSSSVYFRGKTVKMPKFPCHVTLEQETDIPYPAVPTTQVLALVLPPARLHEFWYRMRVTWTIRFENVCSTLDSGDYYTFKDVGESSHGMNYVPTSAKLGASLDSLDADGVEINKVMES